MSSPSECFQCRWQGSRLLLAAYLAGLLLALPVLALSALPAWLAVGIAAALVVHACWAIPRRILLTHPGAVTGLRRDARGWHVFSQAHGWQPVRLCTDSVVVPQLVVLRFVRAGRWLSESQCIPADAMHIEQHRRLRVRLRFGRRRFASTPAAAG
ncbi:protein YgfX [Pseudomonas sp. SMSB3]|uniref:protein YgfX n=1 Tax=unclassified Pseudomonas TaxID=196821 RepID=UPI0011A1FFCA|nr:protein YgfX [Pseudomonas sp. URMO17WK12:I11]